MSIQSRLFPLLKRLNASWSTLTVYIYIYIRLCGRWFEILGEQRRDMYITVICPFTVRHVAGRVAISDHNSPLNVRLTRSFSFFTPFSFSFPSSSSPSSSSSSSSSPSSSSSFAYSPSSYPFFFFPPIPPPFYLATKNLCCHIPFSADGYLWHAVENISRISWNKLTWTRPAGEGAPATGAGYVCVAK